jgi:tetratricopeptide (TPR) repeat protein
VEVGECLTYLANSEKCLKEYEKAIKHYDEAVEVFRRAYGNDHNENTAVAIGNLGLVYKELGRREQEREYLSLAKSILKDLFGEQCPDYQYFDRQSR